MLSYETSENTYELYQSFNILDYVYRVIDSDRVTLFHETLVNEIAEVTVAHRVYRAYVSRIIILFFPARFHILSGI